MRSINNDPKELRQEEVSQNIERGNTSTYVYVGDKQSAVLTLQIDSSRCDTPQTSTSHTLLSHTAF